MSRTIFNSSLAFLCCLVASIAIIALALDFWGAKEIRGDVGEVFFLTLFGTLYLIVCVYLFKWFGIALGDDVIERNNTSALVTLCAATLAAAILYAGGSVGEGPSYSENVFSVGLAVGGFFLFWILLEAGGKISMSIAEERDLASGIRFGGFLLAIGLVLGRSVAGDWHSAPDTIHDFFRDAWPVVIIWGNAVAAEQLTRPNRQRPFPFWPVFGLIPALLYLAMAGAWLWHLGPWEGMPK